MQIDIDLQLIDEHFVDMCIIIRHVVTTFVYRSHKLLCTVTIIPTIATVRSKIIRVVRRARDFPSLF